MIVADRRRLSAFGARGALVASLWLASSMAPSPAGAQSSGALAESLYRDGKRLLDERKYAEACPKLAESERLEPAGGTELALALCYDEWGKIASAWAVYRDALASARKAGRADREKGALEAIKRLEPLLPMLTVTVSPEAAALEGLEVKRDGVSLARVVWGTAIAVDPGTITVEARAPGYQTWKSQITVAGARDTRLVTVPPLARESAAGQPSASAQSPLPPAPSASSPPPPPGSAGTPGEAPKGPSSRATAAYVSLGVGVVGLSVGAIFGARFFSKKSDADAICPNTQCSDRGAVDLSQQAQTAGILSGLSLGVGLVGVGVGSYLLLTGNEASPAQGAKAGPPRLAVTPLLGGGAVLYSGVYLAPS